MKSIAEMRKTTSTGGLSEADAGGRPVRAVPRLVDQAVAAESPSRTR